MARVKLVLDVDSMSMEDLKQYVHNVDETLSGEGNGIATENVTSLDIVQTLLSEGSVVCRVVDESTDERTELTKLGQLVNDVMFNPEVDSSAAIR